MQKIAPRRLQLIQSSAAHQLTSHYRVHSTLAPELQTVESELVRLVTIKPAVAPQTRVQLVHQCRMRQLARRSRAAAASTAVQTRVQKVTSVNPPKTQIYVRHAPQLLTQLAVPHTRAAHLQRAGYPPVQQDSTETHLMKQMCAFDVCLCRTQL